MAYYTRNLDIPDQVICDDCGDSRWETHPKYGTNVDARDEEGKETGIYWSWTPVWGGCDCDTCGTWVK